MGALRLPEARGCCRVVEALHASLPAGMEDLVCPKNQVLFCVSKSLKSRVSERSCWFFFFF